jgi:hypothetical protein
MARYQRLFVFTHCVNIFLFLLSPIIIPSVIERLEYLKHDLQIMNLKGNQSVKKKRESE